MTSRAILLGWPLVPPSKIMTPVALAISGVPGAATVGNVYSFTPIVVGGTPPYSFTLTGSLPTGLSFSSSTGAITGTPSVAGTTSGLSIRVTDSVSSSATLSGLSIVIAAAGPVVLPTPPFDATNLVAWLFDNRAGQGAPYIYTDSVGVNTISGGEDLTANGYGAIRTDKSLQPLKGASGGPITDAGGKSLLIPKPSILNGATKVGFYSKVKPRSDLYAGGGKRTLFCVTQGATSAYALSIAIATGGTGYQVGDYITETGGTFSSAVIIRVDAVSSGVITAASIVDPGFYTVLPTNPVAQGSTSNPANTAAGTGATFNITFSTKGQGSAFERFAVYLSSGTTGRRLYVAQAQADGSVVTSVILSGPQLNNDVFNNIGVELDLTAGTCDFYLNSTTSAYQMTGLATGALGTGNAVSIFIGDNSAVASPSYCEQLGVIVRAGSLPDTTARATILTTYYGMLS